ncbi:uncharacterized protein LOC125568072 [Nematostella vectensis]|uniref:uncharacterized protein LOC125568072 n=1 Tax=Nematostella vectensis TaxID=45351 RepID=UPI0020778B06|nr:uncharacterized protein LOC125568072 [Nematostella vectensis]
MMVEQARLFCTLLEAPPQTEARKNRSVMDKYDNLLLQASFIFMVLFVFQTTCRPYEPTGSSTSSQSLKNLVQKIRTDLKSASTSQEKPHHIMRRESWWHPCVKSKAVNPGTGELEVTCYQTTSIGCYHNLAIYGSTRCKPVAYAHNGKLRVKDCTCL